MNVDSFRYTIKISVHRKSYKASDPKVVYFKQGLTFQLFNRWKWYFRYRAALWQVEYPRQYVELEFIQVKYVPTAVQEKQRLMNRLVAAKGKITQIQRGLAEMQSNWSQLFPIEDDPTYQRYIEKLQEYRDRYNSIKKELL